VKSTITNLHANAPHRDEPTNLSRRGFMVTTALAAAGGIRETQEAVAFCALHGIRPEITKIPMEKIDDAWTKVVDKAARYRFVIDMTRA
jgi:uncharacterized zinc-type alcohol dehydrogenase-like protein